MTWDGQHDKCAEMGVFPEGMLHPYPDTPGGFVGGVPRTLTLGRPWRQEQKRDVGRDRELARGMPSGLVGEEDGVGALGCGADERCRASGDRNSESMWRTA